MSACRRFGSTARRFAPRFCTRPFSVSARPLNVLAIREYRIGKGGITLGPPLINFQGVLRGVPEMIGVEEALMEAEPK